MQPRAREAIAPASRSASTSPAPVPSHDDAAALQALRQATTDIHQRLHGLPPFVAILDGSIDLAGYRALLGRLHAFHAPLEALLDAHAAAFARHGIDLATRRRAALLVDDIAALGGTVEPAPATTSPFDPRSTSELFGAFYVREGSTLGGRVLARHLDALLGTAVDGRRYFAGDPCDGAQWRETRAALERVARVEPDGLQGMVRGATRCFERFARWMS